MVYLQQSNIQITSSLGVARVFLDLLLLEDRIDREKEHFYVMHLNVKSRVKLVELVSIGILNQALITPRETFRRAVIAGSASIIVAHNHPSGDPAPSDADTAITKRLFEVGQILGIHLLDHIIFTPTSFFNFKDNHIKKITEENAQTGREVTHR
jgi:DNA repair protein RadC